MKKEYLRPRLKLTDTFIEQPMMVVSYLNVYDGTGSDEETLDESDYDTNILAKPGIIYDAWEDEDKEIDFHTDV